MCLVSFLLAATAGCALDGEPTPTLDHAQIGCPDTGCGTNSAVVAGSSIAELDEGPKTLALAGGPYDENLIQGAEDNFAGVRLLHLRKGAEFFRADVRGDRLVGRDAAGVVKLAGPQLVGSALVVELPGGEQSFVHIDGFQRDLPFWIKPDQRLIESFRMKWSMSPVFDSSAAPVCPPAAGHEPGSPDDHYAIFFQGDRYHEGTKQVIATGKDAGSWFNLACFKAVPSKLHFYRHTRAGAKKELVATPDQEQALLKMLTADFCGEGKSFTEVGIDLAWENATGWQTLDLPEPISYEAVWGPDGALCLDDARLGNEADILAACDLSPCSEVFPDFPDGWQDAGYLLSANP